MTGKKNTPAKTEQSKGRISAQIKDAINLMVCRGLERKEAAQEAGMTDHGLREALKKSLVRPYHDARERAYLRRAGDDGVREAHRLLHESKSDHVRGDMAKFLAPLSEQYRAQRGEDGAGGGGQTVVIQIGTAEQPQAGWQPPAGAQVPATMLPSCQQQIGDGLSGEDEAAGE